MRSAVALPLVVFLASAAACGGGGSGGVNPAPIIAGFTPDQSAPGDSTVSMELDSRSDDLVSVRVVVTGVQGIFGSAFAVACDPGAGCDPAGADFVQISPGTILEQGGNVPIYTSSPAGVWPVVIGASRTGAVAAVDIAAAQTLLTMTFRVRKEGAFPIKFRNAALIDGARNPIPGLTWYAGTLYGQ